jgi:general secretion pathway protein G
LLLRSAGLDAFLADPRDEALREALHMLEPRLFELPLEIGFDGAPLETFMPLARLAVRPMELVVIEDERARFGIAARLSVELLESETELVLERFTSLLEGAQAPVQLVERAGAGSLGTFSVAGEPVRFGVSRRAEGDAPRFVLDWSDVGDASFELPDARLSGDARALFEFSLDSAGLSKLLDRAAEAEPEAAKLVSVLEILGLLGDPAFSVSFALGDAGDRWITTGRVRNGAALARRLQRLPAGGFDGRTARLIPPDATFAMIQRSNLKGALAPARAILESQGQDPLPMIQQMIGIDVQAEILDPLGSESGFYTSRTTGGGGLASSVVFAAVEDEATLSATFHKLAGLANGAAAAVSRGYVAVRSTRIAEVPAWQVQFPGLPVPLEPCWALADGFLVAGATPQALQAALLRLRGGGRSLLDREEVRAVIGRRGPALLRLVFVDAAETLEDGYGWTALIASAIANGVRSPRDASREPGLLLPTFETLSDGARSMVSAWFLDGEDLVLSGEMDRSSLVHLTMFLGGPIAEMYVPMVIAGVASSLVVPMVVQSAFEQRESGMDVAAVLDLTVLYQALQDFAVKNEGRYPDSLELLVIPDEQGFTYLDQPELPLDPWGRPYVYEALDEGREFLLYSLGADDAPGGEGEAADVYPPDQNGAASEDS